MPTTSCLWDSLRKFFLLSSVILVCAFTLWGQASQVSQIAGTVQDTTGAVVPGATVTVTNTNTGIARTVTAGADGAYVVTNLPVGQYRMQVTKDGFAPYIQRGIALSVNTNPHINVTLQVGGVTQQVDVEANAAMVETHSTGVGQVIDQSRVVDLPLNGRQVTQLVTLAGGATDAVPTNAGQALTSNKNYPTSVAFSVAGGQGGQTLFLLDGGNNMDVISNVGLPMPFPDALQEFKVETSSLPANYGNQPGGVVNVVTKSGGNAFHGDVFEFLRNYAANARNFFAPARDSLKRNQFGGTLGGPIIQNKLFFFGGYQGTRESVAPSSNTTFVPTLAELQGDFSALAACNHVTLRGPFVNNKVDPSLLNPVAVKFLKYIPISTDPCGKLTYGIPSQDHENQGVVRVDWQINSGQSLFARYFVTDYQHPPYYTNNLLTLSTDPSAGLSDRVNTIVLGHTYTISPTTISSFRAGFTRSSVLRYLPSSVPTWTQLGAKVYQGVPAYLYLSIAGYFQPICTNCNPGPWFSTNYQLSDEVTMIRGPQEIAVGVNVINSRLNAFSNFQRNGNFTFNGNFTGNALADFMLGLPSSFTQNNGQIGDERLTQPSLYVQDNIRLKSNLQVNVGLRWDPYMAPSKAVPQVSIFDLGWYNAGVQSTVFTNAPAGTLFVGDKGMPGNHYFFGRLGEFAPRLGVVYDPRGKGNETIRAGYGIFYGGTPLWQQAGIFAPFTAPVSIPSPAGGLSDPFAGAVVSNPYPEPNPLPSNVAFPKFGTGLGNFKLHPKPTYIEQWNLSFQKQLSADWMFSATYLGNRTVHLEYGEPYNPAIYIPGNCTAGQYGLTAAGPCSNVANTNYRRVLYMADPVKAMDYADLTAFGDGANANYNGLLLSIQHRFAHNFTVLANHTWSHCLGESEVALNGAGPGQDPFNRHAEYGNCLSDHRHVFNLTSVVGSPKFTSRSLNRFLGGWQESTIFTARSGGYSTVRVSSDNSRTGRGADRPNVVGDPNLSDPTIYQWFNTAAFQANPIGAFGDAGRDTVLGPGAWNIDVALSRSFAVKESQRIAVRAEAFNVMNHTRFGNPGTTLNTPTFGVITTALDPRIMQFALKYIF
jgi:hypothetical protein